MYYNHNLRVNLKEWRNRIMKASYDQFRNAHKYFMDKVKKTPALYAILLESRYMSSIEDFAGLDMDNFEYTGYENEEEEAVFKFRLIEHYISQPNYDHERLLWQFFNTQHNSDRVSEYVEMMIDPIVNYLEDVIDESSSVLFLLEKYKLRSEWFFKEKLNDLYHNNSKTGENKLEADLRLFLFDQGIEFPFSTPLSTSGRADVVSMLHTEDPLVLEIKIVDDKKGYGSNRIKGGFAQVVKYADDYHKNIGYLLIFNFDAVKIQISGNESDNTWPQRVKFRDKIFYLIFVDLHQSVSASQTGVIKKLTISVDELTAEA